MELIFHGISTQQGLLIIFNLIIIESLLSVDNAAVLATMVLDLPKEQRGKALKYGILGAYIFRGICLLLASYLVNIWWLKPIGGLYLVYLTCNYFLTKNTSKQEQEVKKSKNPLYRFLRNRIGVFWGTVVLVETMDLVFSIDNVLAAAAFVENVPKPTQTYLLWTGVFIGILAMRLVAQTFVHLLEKFAFLENCAFVVIFILGVKLTASGVTHFFPESGITKALDSHTADTVLSLVTTGVFALPILSSLLFNFPKKNIIQESEMSNKKDIK